MLCSFDGRLLQAIADAVEMLWVEQEKEDDEAETAPELRRTVVVNRSQTTRGLGRRTEGGSGLDLESSSVSRKQKYYAVRRGRTLGLYFSWADCSREVTGWRGAEHRSFVSLADAEAYLFDRPG